VKPPFKNFFSLVFTSTASKINLKLGGVGHHVMKLLPLLVGRQRWSSWRRRRRRRRKEATKGIWETEWREKRCEVINERV
jgi:hypothetical protein